MEELAGTAQARMQSGDAILIETPGGGGYGAKIIPLTTVDTHPGCGKEDGAAIASMLAAGLGKGPDHHAVSQPGPDTTEGHDQGQWLAGAIMQEPDQ